MYFQLSQGALEYFGHFSSQTRAPAAAALVSAADAAPAAAALVSAAAAAAARTKL